MFASYSLSLAALLLLSISGMPQAGNGSPQNSSAGQSIPTRPAPNSGGSAMVPQEMRNASPPAANATPEQLEERGDELRDQKAYADALDYYRAAIAKAPSAQVHNKAGIAELEMVRYEDAKREFQRAIKLDRNYAEAYNNLGVVEYIHKKYKQAIKRYEQAIRLHADSASFYSNLGTAYFARKQYAQATANYAHALQLDPDIFERRSNGGVSLYLSSVEDRARHDYVLAKMYAATGNNDRGLQYLRKAIEEGYPGIKDVYKDSEFAKLRQDPRFPALMAKKIPAITN
jgi:tetratricopeptide (TPR) repeat protein